MDTKRFLTGAIVGGVVLYAVGYVIWDVVFASFFEANAGSATGVWREARIHWAAVVSHLAYGALLTYVIASRGATSIPSGAMTGAIVAGLMWTGVDFFFYGAANLSNLTATLVDPALEFVHGGLAGAAIAAVAGKGAA